MKGILAPRGILGAKRKKRRWMGEEIRGRTNSKKRKESQSKEGSRAVESPYRHWGKTRKEFKGVVTRHIRGRPVERKKGPKTSRGGVVPETFTVGSVGKRGNAKRWGGAG